MFIFRGVARFCRARTYIQKFKDLEAEVTRIEKEYLVEKDELQKVEQIANLSNANKIIKMAFTLINKPYENEALQAQKQKISSMLKQLEVLEDEGKSRVEISLKLKKEEQGRREELFLTDLANFSLQYRQFLESRNQKCQILEGLELSYRTFDKLLQKQKVEWLGEKNQSFDHEIHDRVQGDSEKVNQVVKKGFKIKGKVIEKAKVE